jgi:hypothetical protein
MNLKNVPILLLMAIALGSTMASLQADDWPMRGRDIFRRSWVAGDTLYVTDERGDVEILRSSASYELRARINHDQPT